MSISGFCMFLGSRSDARVCRLYAIGLEASGALRHTNHVTASVSCSCTPWVGAVELHDRMRQHRGCLRNEPGFLCKCYSRHPSHGVQVVLVRVRLTLGV